MEMTTIRYLEATTKTALDANWSLSAARDL